MISNLRRFLEESTPRYLHILEEMVSINSWTENREGVRALGEYTADLFAGLGFTPEFIPSRNPLYGSHVILTRKGSGRASISCVSHLDTVFPPGEEEGHDFHFRLEGGRASGPGTSDIKGGTLVMFMMLESLSHELPSLFESVNWKLLFDASEETVSDDFGELCLENMDADTLACLIFEADGGRIDEFSLVTSRKGRAVFTIESFGRAAHAGSAHHSGANAIVHLCGIVERAAAITDYKRGITVNVGTITGGTALNRVPDYAAAKVEMRAHDESAFREAVDAMLALAGSDPPGRKNLQCTAKISLDRRVPSWPENERTNHLFSVWREAASIAGMPIVPERRGGLSDGNWLWHRVPAIDGLGPVGGNEHCSGGPGTDHAGQEFIITGSLAPKAALNALALVILLQSFFAGSEPSA